MVASRGPHNKGDAEMSASGESTAWICLVCGYVHQGDAPPDACPICDAPPSDFEPHKTVPPKRPTATRQWRCLVCGYVHEGDGPPECCEICNAPAEDFEPCVPSAAPGVAQGVGGSRTILIIGGGIAGLSAAEAARQSAPDAHIALASREVERPYYRLNLTRYLAGEIGAEALDIHPPAWYEERRIRLLVNAETTELDLDGSKAIFSGNAPESFDKLILACGAHPFMPPIPGADKEGVAAIRTKRDVDEVLARLRPDMPCVCIGGGILGLETAGALARRGAKPTIIEGFDYLLPRQLNQDAARLLERRIQELGIVVRTRGAVKAIAGDACAEAVLLEDGASLPTALTTITTGVRPNSHLARRAGLAVNQGILVDARMTTSHPDVYAAGDCAEFDGAPGGLWEPARHQGAIAGHNAAGAHAEFGGLPRMNMLKVLGIDLFSIGAIQPADGSYREIAGEDDGVYRRFLFRDNVLAGAILLGDGSLSAVLTRMVREGVDCSPLLARRPNALEATDYFASR